MKKLILTTVLLLTILTLQAQQHFTGDWVCNESSYITTILVNKKGDVDISNYSFAENKTQKESVLQASSVSVKTHIYNKRNGYRIYIEYIRIDNNTLLCKYTGDFVGNIIKTRLRLN